MNTITAPLHMSDVAQRLLWLDGAPFSLADYPMYRAIYDGRFKSTLMMCGRQVAKSTSLANFIITESVSIPFFKEYYLSPTKEQTLTFSNLRVGKTLAYSPLVKKHFQSPEHSDRVLHRSYTNGSENGFTYACDDADRARGFSADRVLYDEFQDMLYDAVVPVVNACLKNSKYRYETYAGTPKSMEASIQYLWERSTQSEWVMKCSSCGKYNFVVSDKSLGKHGPICLNCGTVLNPRFGQWVDMKVTRPGDTALIKGFHIPRLIMPSDVPIANPGKEADAQSRWDDILRDYGLHSPARFRNEVLGVSDAIGQRLISLEELMALCGNRGGLHRTPQHGSKHMEGVTMAVAGVDWTGGGQAGISRTVLWVWGYVPAEQRLKVLYYRVYPNNNAVSDVKDIAEVCNNFNVALVVGDAGEGNLPNSMLREALGAHRTTAVQYGSQKTAMTWNGVDRFMLDRTTMIDNYIMLLKKQGVLYEDYPVMRVAIEDVLNVYEEVTLSGKKVWRHSPQLPDDCLHAQIFGWLALKIRLADTKFYQ